MQNNFISKTIKTFVTSLVISVFVFGSFYFLLSDNSESTDSSESAVSKKENTTKLVMEEESTSKEEDSNKLGNSSIDVKKEVLGVTTNNSTNSQVQSGGMLAQISDTYVEPVETTPTATLTTPTTVVVPPVTFTSTTTTATGVPTTGNEGLYILMAAFSIISGFLITNGKDLAMKNFEK